MLGEKPLAIGPDVLKKEIAKYDRVDPLVTVCGKCLPHLCLVLIVGRTLGNQNLVKRDPEAVRLPFEQEAPDTMHADSVEVACDGREQRLHTNVRRSLKLAKGEATVFAATPGYQDSFHRNWLSVGLSITAVPVEHDLVASKTIAALRLAPIRLVLAVNP